jgi:RNA 3'-terminal phosphate cyclase-like protein
MVDAARGMLNDLLPDVYIFTDHRAGKAAGPGPGFGLSLVAETTTGCALAADDCVRRADGSSVLLPAVAGGGGSDGAGEGDTPEDVGARVTGALLVEVAAGGVVDGSHQATALFLAAVGPDAMSTLRLGRLSPAAVRLLREMRDIAGVTFNLEPDPADGSVTASCIGLGLGNTARAVT